MSNIKTADAIRQGSIQGRYNFGTRFAHRYPPTPGMKYPWTAYTLLHSMALTPKQAVARWLEYGIWHYEQNGVYYAQRNVPVYKSRFTLRYT